MGKIAFIYPGQGAQKTGMGADFYLESQTARTLFDEAGNLLGIDMKRLCFEENDLLDQTEYTQAAMVTACLAITRVLQERGIHPDMTAGLSLGEYAAIAAAGGMDELEAVRLVRKRGILMQYCVPEKEGVMSAVIGAETDVIETVTDQIDGVSIANYNCPGQIVITGYADAVEAAEKRIKEAGARRLVRLNVSGAFHSPLQEQAGEELKQELKQTQLHALKVPYVTNVTAEKVTDITAARQLLVRQMSAPVMWMQSMQTMIRSGVDTFVEIGPGRTLAGFLKKIDSSVNVINVSSWSDIEKVEAMLV